VAKPQTENGFVMIALDLFAAIMVADLPNRCMIVLAEHLVQSYGPAKKRDVLLDPVTIEGHTGLHRNNVRRAIGELTDAQILGRHPGGTFRFNKDYESWTPGGQPLASRLGGGPLEFALWALQSQGKPNKPSAKDPIQRDCPEGNASTKDPIQRDCPEGNASTKDPIQRDCPAIQRDCGAEGSDNPVGLRARRGTTSNGIGSFADTNHASNPQGPLAATGSDDSLAGVRAPARELEILDKKSALRARAREDPESLTATDLADLLPCPTEDTAMLPPISGTHRPTRAEVEACWTNLRDHFGATLGDKRRLCNGYFEHQCMHAHVFWLEAIREAYRRGKTQIQSIAYIETIASAFEANGIPERKARPGAKPGAELPESKPRQYHQAPADRKPRQWIPPDARKRDSES
jgi:hypothetical protein